MKLEVKDGGPGIGPEQQDRIFEPFVQAENGLTTSKGTGLGLTISKSFVNLMGGKISVESELGEGTIFYIELPMLLTETAKAKDVEAGKRVVKGLEPGHPKWRILIVEDDPENRLLSRQNRRRLDADARRAVRCVVARAMYVETEASERFPAEVCPLERRSPRPAC